MLFKDKKWNILAYLLKIGLTVSIGWFLYQGLDQKKLLGVLSNCRVGYLSMALLLLIPNLLLQYAKWHYLLSGLGKRISRLEILGSVFVGVAFGLTPGRVGEVGKLFFIKNVNRMHLLGLAVIEKIYDLYPVIIFGLLSLPMLPDAFFTALLINRIAAFLLAILVIMAVLLLVFYPGMIAVLLKYIDIAVLHRNRYYEQMISAFQSFKQAQSLVLFRYTVMLFLVYTSQFVLLSTSLDPGADIYMYPAGWLSILLKTLLPVSIGDIGIREGAAALIYPHFGFNKEAAVSAAMLLFIINLLLPALIGVLLMPFLKIVRNKRKKES